MMFEAVSINDDKYKQLINLPMLNPIQENNKTIEQKQAAQQVDYNTFGQD